eukprot:GILJ01013508.1.p1 GENE.GILJ01013508.1~~GILJ01013508.1.p1  ORF type:complete len:878 (+),score=173.64 GILJ01013508.1:242-2635(+)
MYMKDRLARPFNSELENDITYATYFDKQAPDKKYIEKIVSYVTRCTSDASNSREVIQLLIKRLSGANTIVVTKVLMVIHRLITYTDIKFIDPLGEPTQQEAFQAACRECRARVMNGQHCVLGSSVLPLIEIYCAYLQALRTHIKDITSILAINIFKEKQHNNEFLARMEMDAAIAGVVQQSTEVLMIISMMPVQPELFQLDLTKCLFTGLIIDALCLYGFDSKALDIAFIQRKGIKDKAGLQRWLRAFQAFENVGVRLNQFFDAVCKVHVQLPVQIPKLVTPLEGTASKIRTHMKEILATPETDYIDECVIDDALANAQMAAGLESPASQCFSKRSKSMASVTSPTGKQLTKTHSTYTGTTGGLTVSTSKTDRSEDVTDSLNSTKTDSSDVRVTGFQMPLDASDYTIQREYSTMISVANTLDSTIANSISITNTNTDPLRSPLMSGDINHSNSNRSNPTPTSVASNIDTSARFVVFTEELLGKGSYGTVLKAWDEEEGKLVACKQISTTRGNPRQSAMRRQQRKDESGTEMADAMDTALSLSSGLKSEFEVLTALSHENIVKVYAFQSQPSVSRIFMEWVPGGSVQDLFKRTGRGLSVQVIKRYITHALRGLAFVHEKHVVHRDIKPGNMLIDSTGVIKLTDFGTSKFLEVVGAQEEESDDLNSTQGSTSGNASSNGSSAAFMSTKSIVGTIPYLAPENFQGLYGTPSDIWAIGASAVHMYTSRVPWAEKGFREPLQLIFCIGNAKQPNHAPSYNANLPDLALPTGDFKAFLDACFTFDVEQRPTAQQLLQHKFLTE